MAVMKTLQPFMKIIYYGITQTVPEFVFDFAIQEICAASLFAPPIFVTVCVPLVSVQVQSYFLLQEVPKTSKPANAERVKIFFIQCFLYVNRIVLKI